MRQTIASPTRLIPAHLSVSDIFVIVPPDMNARRCEDAIGLVLARNDLQHHRCTIVAAQDGAHLKRGQWLFVSLASTAEPLWNAPLQELGQYDRAVRRVESLIYATLAAVRADLGLTGQPTASPAT